MKHNHIIAKEGWIFVIAPLVIAGILLFFSYQISALFFHVIALFCAFFFRNPNRKITSSPDALLSPADGKIIEINRVFENRYIKAECYQIKIFLNIFNVHINRTPIAGRVELVEKTGGLYLAAYKKDASEKNVRNYIGLLTEFGPILITQITGLVARRVVCWVKQGDALSSGERFGLIRFGSCTELYLPLDVDINVKIGDKVKGGQTIIARFNR